MVYDKIKFLCNERNITIAKLERATQLSNGSIIKWETSSPKVENLQKIALYFNVTIDYLLGSEENNLPSNLVPLDSSELITFPIIASISAGYDSVPVFNDDGENIDVPLSVLRTRNPNDYFVLKVKGNSMYPKFLPGDKVLVFRTSSVDSGSIVAVGYNGDEATLKRVIYKIGEDWMELVPLNPEYEVKKIIGTDLEQCRVYGKVVYLFRDNFY